MSMKMLSILQTIEIFSVYSLVVFLLPFFVLHKKVKDCRLSAKFMIYLVAGNFYMINLVFLLQLLHISNRFTLILFTIIPVLFAGIRINRIPAKKIVGIQLTNIKRLANGQLGRRSMLRKIRLWFKEAVHSIGKWLFENVGKRMHEWILVLGIVGLICWIYGSNMMTTYGYTASDIPVHNYWINYMSRENQIFVNGVYPFGFHCVIYYLHTVFGIETYVLLRLFWLVQTIYIHLVLLAFLKGCCKSGFLPYAGTALYIVANLFGILTYSRYYSSLPQEFGMIFILPSIYFLIAYFEKRKEELEHFRLCQYADRYLAGFVMSFSMTLAVHFYCTMIAGLFCIGIGIGYGFRFFRKKYFIPIISAGIISLIIAILPMGIAYAAGTPLQGSLNWGMSVISGETGEETQEQEPAEEAKNEKIQDEEITQNTAKKEVVEKSEELDIAPTAKSISILFRESTMQNRDKYPTVILNRTMPEKIVSLGKRILEQVTEYMTYHVAFQENPWVCRLAYAGILGCIVLGAAFFLLKQFDYGARLISASLFMMLMSLLLAAGGLGIPELMDANRCSIFYAYMVIVLWTFCVDALLTFVLGWWKLRYLVPPVSVVAAVCLAFGMIQADMIKEPLKMPGYETNEAITCLTNIIRDNEDGTWTICSANDELRMCEDYGYHFETIDLLRRMEQQGPRTNLTIPTRYVYFFIEKIPIEYASDYEKLGQSVSKKGADNGLPLTGGLSVYQGENRWIVMSRMYYWAKTFQSMYPNEMKVYYETEDFICYRIEQNDYSLYNFSIDYGYNMKEYEYKIEEKGEL